jgi:hypothetical protein
LRAERRGGSSESARGSSRRWGTVDTPGRSALLSSELIVGGVLSVIHRSILEGDRKLVELAPSVMAFIVAPYLGQAAAQAELEGRPSAGGDAFARDGLEPSRSQKAGQLPVRATHRTTLVLRAIARAPYSNHREVGHAAGLADEGQTSKLPQAQKAASARV